MSNKMDIGVRIQELLFTLSRRHFLKRSACLNVRSRIDPV